MPEWMVSSFRRVPARRPAIASSCWITTWRYKGWMVISREAPWLIIIHYLCKRLAKPGCQVETMTNFNEETYSNWPQFLGWSSIRMIWYLVCVYCKPCCGIWTYCCVDAFVSSNVCQQCFGILQFDELNWINYRFILLGCWFQIPLKPFECSMLARMVISIWQISHQYNTAVLIWFSWVESIWHQPISHSIHVYDWSSQEGNPECLQHMLMSDEKLQGWRFTQLLADQQELLGGSWRVVAFGLQKWWRAPTKYPSQWGTDGESMGNWCLTSGLGASYLQTNHRCAVYST